MAKTVIRGEIDLTGVTATRYISSDPIDVNSFSSEGNFNLWTRIYGDTGRSGGGVSITWEGNWITTSGTSYWVTPTGTSFIRTSGTSVSGPKSNGIDSATFTPDIFPWLRIIAAPNNGSATTSTAIVNWTLIFE